MRICYNKNYEYNENFSKLINYMREREKEKKKKTFISNLWIKYLNNLKLIDLK